MGSELANGQSLYGSTFQINKTTYFEDFRIIIILSVALQVDRFAFFVSMGSRLAAAESSHEHSLLFSPWVPTQEGQAAGLCPDHKLGNPPHYRGQPAQAALGSVPTCPTHVVPGQLKQPKVHVGDGVKGTTSKENHFCLL